MPAAAIVRPSRLRTIWVGPRRATTRSGLLGERVVALARADPALGLADHLAGDHDDVAVAPDRSWTAIRAARSDSVVISGRPSGAVTSSRGVTSDGPAPIAAAAMAAVASWSVIIRGTATHADAGGLDRGDVVGVGLVDQPAVEHAAVAARPVVAATAAGRHVDADRGRASGGPSRARGCRRRWGRGRRPGRTWRSALARMPGTPRIVPTDTTGLDGGRMTRSAPVMASSTPGAGVDWSRPTKASASAGTSAWSRTQYSWKWTTRLPLGASASAIATCVSTRSSDIGSSRTPGLPPRAQGLGDLGEGVARLQHLAPDEVGRDVAVAQSEPRRLHAVRLELRLGAPGLVACGPTRARGRCPRRGCTSRCRDRGRP